MNTPRRSAAASMSARRSSNAPRLPRPRARRARLRRRARPWRRRWSGGRCGAPDPASGRLASTPRRAPGSYREWLPAAWRSASASRRCLPALRRRGRAPRRPHTLARCPERTCRGRHLSLHALMSDEVALPSALGRRSGRPGASSALLASSLPMTLKPCFSNSPTSTLSRASSPLRASETTLGSSIAPRMSSLRSLKFGPSHDAGEDDILAAGGLQPVDHAANLSEADHRPRIFGEGWLFEALQAEDIDALPACDGVAGNGDREFPQPCDQSQRRGHGSGRLADGPVAAGLDEGDMSSMASGWSAKSCAALARRSLNRPSPKEDCLVSTADLHQLASCRTRAA
jgi:hypothetical protein